MENIFSKLAVFLVCTSSTSCAFDGEYPIKKVAKISECYYVVKDISAPDYGFMITYTVNNANDGTDGEDVTHNCVDVYSNKDTIMYSKTSLKGGSTLSYYLIPINPKREDGLRNDPIQIKEGFFQGSIGRFTKVNIR